MRQGSFLLSILGLFLSGTLLASCGDLQGPGTDSQGTSVSSPSLSQAPAQEKDSNTPQSLSPTDQVSSLPSTDATQQPMDAGTGMHSGTFLNGTQPQSAGSDNQPVTRSLTLTWDPDPSGNTSGYRVYVTTESSAAHYAYDAGPEAQIRLTLPTGNRYSFTVTGNNAAGESPPSSAVQYDLF